MERNQVCGEIETMLNSCPGKGIVDTVCAKMNDGVIIPFSTMFWSNEPQRTSIHQESAREESAQVGSQRYFDFILVNGNPNECWVTSVS